MKAKLFILVVAISAILSVPLAHSLSEKSALLEIEKSKTDKLELRIKTDAKIKQELEKKNQELQQQLQAKRDKAAKLAAEAEANAKQAAEKAAAAARVVVQAGGCESYRGIVAQYNWDVRMAMAIMQAENHTCDPTRDNAGLNSDGSVDYGLFQVNSTHADLVGGNLESLRVPAVNIATAYKIYAGSNNWSPWSTFKNGAYLAHL